MLIVEQEEEWPMIRVKDFLIDASKILFTNYSRVCGEVTIVMDGNNRITVAMLREDYDVLTVKLKKMKAPQPIYRKTSPCDHALF